MDYDPRVGCAGSEDYEINDAFRGKDEEQIFMQFTGLLDKNEKEIYEGDIFAIDGEVLPCPVTYEGDGFILKNSKHLSEAFGSWERRQNKYEVIGNIYQNPELTSLK